MLFEEHQFVPNAEGLEQKPRSIAQFEQTIGILGVEKESINPLERLVFLVLFAEVVVQQGAVKQQLHVMSFLMSRCIGIGIGRKSALARLLFDKYLIIGLQEVHASLYAEQLTEERRFEQKTLRVEAADFLGQYFFECMAYVLFLLFGVFVELFAQCIAGRHAECVAFEETLDALCIGFVFGMHLLIEQLTGEVSQQYGIGAHAGFYLIEQMDARIVGIGFETSGYRRYVYQVIRLVDEQFGIHDTVILARVYYVELRAVAQ